MKYRKVRIAWSVAWGIACLMLVALWVRSYQFLDFYEWSSSERNYDVWSNRGEFNISRMMFFSGPFAAHGGSLPTQPREKYVAEPQHRVLGINSSIYDCGWSAGVYLVVLAAFGGATAIVPWLRWNWRFSLRTLLIATTVAAIGLGWIVHTTRK